MMENTGQRARQALILWGVYIVLNILLNGTIPFVLGRDLHAWTASPIAVLLIALLSGARRFFNSDPFSFDPFGAVLAGLDRLFLNPASTTENLFYFGFLAERLSWKFGRWATALLVGLMAWADFLCSSALQKV